MSRKVAVFVFCGLMACAGAQTPAQEKPTEEPKDKKETAEKMLETAAKSPGAAVDPNTFQIGPEDVIFVRVWHDADFTQAHVVRPDGRITLPIVGEVQAGGLTPVQLGKKISESLATIIKDPQVDVSVAQVHSKKYYIQGEVLKAGSFPLVVPTTILEALSNSGGFKDFANKKKIVVLRKGKRITFNYQEVIKGKHQEQNIFLENGDLIVVP